MKKQILSIAIIALALVSCQKELIDPEQPKIETSTFSARIENANSTKTTLVGETKVNWEQGDEILINGTSYTADEAGETSEFSTKGKGVEGSEYHAFYGVQEPNGASGTLPSTQNYAAGKISNLPMYAYSKDYSLTFHNICSVFAVKVTEADINNVLTITLSSDDKAMCGEFTVENDVAVLKQATESANTVTLNCGKGVDPGKDGTIFYIAIPAQTYTNIKVVISDGKATKTMTTKVKVITTVVNTIYPMNFLIEGSSVLLEAPFIDAIL